MMKKIKTTIAILACIIALCTGSVSLAVPPTGGNSGYDHWTPEERAAYKEWANGMGEAIKNSSDGISIDAETMGDGTQLTRVVWHMDTGTVEERDNVRSVDSKEYDKFKKYEKISLEEYYRYHMDSEDASYVVVRNEETGEIEMAVVPTGITLTESEISKSISTLKSNGFSWYPAHFVYTAPSLECNETHTYYDGCSIGEDGKSNCGGHTVNCNAEINDANWEYFWTNAAPINDKIQADNLPSFKPLFTKGAGSSGTRGLPAVTHDVFSYEYEGVIWRGTDKPRILSGPKEMSGSGRASNGSTTQHFLVKMVDDPSKGDRYTDSIQSYCRQIRKTATHTTNYFRDYEENITVRTYRGVAKPTGDETSTSNFILPMLISNNTTYHASGRMIQSSTPVTFYPTIRMTWQNVSQYGSKNDASVRSEQLSTIIPNNYAEAGWFNESYESNKPTMNLKSNQWSTHVRATQPDSMIKDWA